MVKKMAALMFCLVVLCPSALAYWVSDGETVYITPTGECYHQETCGYIDLETAKGMPYSQAISSGYRGCSWCIEEYTDDWEMYGDFLWYNPFLDQWRDEEGYLYNDPTEAYDAMGYYPSEDGDMWIGEYGYLVDGEYYPYPDDVPDYCPDCEEIEGHSEFCTEYGGDDDSDASGSSGSSYPAEPTASDSGEKDVDWVERAAFGVGGLGIGFGSFGLYHLLKRKHE